MLINIYWNKRDGSVIVPTVAQTEAGYWLDIDPVELGSWSNPESVKAAVERAYERSGQVVPTPSRQNFPKPVVLSHSSAKTLGDFEKKYEMVSISRTQAGRLTLSRYKEAPEGRGRVVDSDLVQPPELSLDQLIDSLAQTISWKTKAS